MATTDQQRAAELGTYLQPGIGEAYPELSASLLRLYKDRVAKLAFVPASWYPRVEADAAGGNIVLLVQPSPYGVRNSTPLPPWIDNDQVAVAAWQKVAKVALDAYSQFAAQQVDSGREILADAYANAAFWSGLYQVATTIRDLPGTVVAAVGGGALDVAMSFLKKAWWVLLLVAVVAFVWVNRGAIASKVNEKAKKAAGLA